MALLGVILTMCALLSSVAGSTCSFEYIRQPPSTTLDGCDPYSSGNTIQYNVECFVRRRAMVTDEFEVRWFRENTAGAVEDLGLGNPDQILGPDWLSRYHNTAFFNQPYSPSLLGKYWCQVINTTADPDQPLMRSNVFTLLAPGNYSGAPCSSVNALDNRTCADQPVSLTTTTVPVLVPSSTTMTQMSTSFIEPSTATQPTANTASLTSEQTTSVTSILPSITTDRAVTSINSAVSTTDSAVTTTDDAVTDIDSAVTTILPSITAVANIPTSVTSNNAAVTTALTPPASSPSSTPQLGSQEEQVSPFLYVIASIGGIFLITIVILIVVIIVMLLKKNQTGQKEVGLDNEAYGLNEVNAVQGAYTAKPEMKSFQKNVEDSPEDYAEPVLTLQRSGYPAPSRPANGGRNEYSSLNTPTQHMVNRHYGKEDPSIPQGNGYSCLQHDTSPPPPTSCPYGKQDHTQPNNLPVTAVYSTLEDSNAPVYNTLGGTDNDYEDPDYSNIAPEENRAVHPHYVEEYDSAVNYHPPSTANSMKNGRYNRDPPHH